MTGVEITVVSADFLVWRITSSTLGHGDHVTQFPRVTPTSSAFQKKKKKKMKVISLEHASMCVNELQNILRYTELISRTVNLFVSASAPFA